MTSSLRPLELASPSWPSSQWPNTPASVDQGMCPVDTIEAMDHSSLCPAQVNNCELQTSPSSDTPFEELMYQVLSLLIKEEEKATLIIRDAVCAEKQWKKSLADLLEKEHSALNTYQKRNDVAHKASDLVLPLSLIAEGVVSIFATGVGLLPLGAAAFGALLLLDTVLDNKAKQTLASTLGKGSEESTKGWLQNISMVTSLTIFGLGLLLDGQQAVTLASNASKLAFTCTQIGTESVLNNQKARLIESEHQWRDSEQNMRDLLRDVERQVKAVNSLFGLLTDLNKSTSEASSQIFR